MMKEGDWGGKRGRGVQKIICTCLESEAEMGEMEGYKFKYHPFTQFNILTLVSKNSHLFF